MNTLQFDGVTFDANQDAKRLTKQLNAVQTLMLDGQWRTLAEIEEQTGHPQASVSARLRDLRKPRFGAYVVERRRRSPGTFEYRVLIVGTDAQIQMPLGGVA